MGSRSYGSNNASTYYPYTQRKPSSYPHDNSHDNRFINKHSLIFLTMESDGTIIVMCVDVGTYGHRNQQWNQPYGAMNNHPRPRQVYQPPPRPAKNYYTGQRMLLRMMKMAEEDGHQRKRKEEDNNRVIYQLIMNVYMLV